MQHSGPDNSEADNEAANAADASEKLTAVQESDPAKALGWAVSYLMTKPSFAALPFGHWSSTLVGQINRKHYLFALRGTKIVGFFGWALTTEDKAEAWLKGGVELKYKDSHEGDCIVINAWEAMDDEVQAFVTDKFRRIIMGKRMIYAKRFYEDGRVRPLKVSVNKFVGNHVKRGNDTGMI